LTPEGLLFKFDPYRVDAYAGGTRKVMIPFSELEGLMRKNNPANKDNRIKKAGNFSPAF
jgi:hypothetical protein